MIINDIYKEKIYDKESNKLLYCDLDKHSYFDSNLHSLFIEKNDLTLTKIRNYLTNKKISYTEGELKYALAHLYIIDGCLVRNDFWNKETVYTYLSEPRYHASSRSKNYYSFIVDDNKTKKFLVITDTHIGNEQIEDFKLLDKVYDYGIYKGVKKCFHLGDLFTGDITDVPLTKKEKLKQIKRFIKYYPNPSPKEMMTYCLYGNNDLEIDSMYWHDGYSPIFYDLRELNFFNPSFNIIPREECEIKFLNKSFAFSHHYRQNLGYPKLKITTEMDVLNKTNEFKHYHDVYFSGHLHDGFIYKSKPAKIDDTDQLFLATPATGKINLNKPVAYLITLNYNDKGDDILSMDISILNCNSNYKITESNYLTWYFNGNNDVNKKIRRI